MSTDYQGAEYIRGAICKDISPLGIEVANILGQAWAGIYHLEHEIRHKRTHWENPHWIEIVIYGGLATWDFNQLTQLVVLCHDRAIRLEINGAANGYLKLMFHPRKRKGLSIYSKHPTLEENTKLIRDGVGLDIV